MGMPGLTRKPESIMFGEECIKDATIKTINDIPLMVLEELRFAKDGTHSQTF
jgi:hypothetical protein